MKITKKNIRIKYNNISVIDTTYDLTMEALGYVDVNYDYVIPVEYNDYLGRYKSDILFESDTSKFYFIIYQELRGYSYIVWEKTYRENINIKEGNTKTLRDAIQHAIWDMINHCSYVEDIKLVGNIKE